MAEALWCWMVPPTHDAETLFPCFCFNPKRAAMVASLRFDQQNVALSDPA